MNWALRWVWRIFHRPERHHTAHKTDTPTALRQTEKKKQKILPHMQATRSTPSSLKASSFCTKDGTYMPARTSQIQHWAPRHERNKREREREEEGKVMSMGRQTDMLVGAYRSKGTRDSELRRVSRYQHEFPERCPKSNSKTLQKKRGRKNRPAITPSQPKHNPAKSHETHALAL